ncbi:MAG: TonB-dependent receptor [Vicinamibacterales bacterium]
MTRVPRGRSGRHLSIPFSIRRFVRAGAAVRAGTACAAATRAVLVLALVLLTAGAALAETLAGRVRDPHDRPVPGARVLVLRAGIVVATATTRRDGGFGPIDLPAGSYEVIASAPGLRAAPRAVAIAPSRAADLDLRLAVSAVEESVVVSAGQVDVPLTRAADSVAVITRDELVRRQRETVADALRAIPGFGVVASGGRGAITSLFPRGGESDYTLVMADGVVLNAFGGGFDAGHLPVEDLERVEVVRGPESAVLGGGAIGGVVQLVTRRGGPLRGDATVEGGGDGTTRAAAGGAGSFGAWQWGAGLERLASDGDTRVRPSIGAAVSNDDYARTSGSVSLAWSDRPARRISMSLRRSIDRRGFPGPYGSDPAGLYGGLDTVSRGENRQTTLALSGAVGDGRVRHSGLVTWARMPSEYVSPFGASDARTGRLTGRDQADVRGFPFGLSAGAEVVGERADSTYVTGEAFQPIPVRRLVAGFFGETRWTLGPRVSVVAGARVERIERHALEGDPNPYGPRPAFDADVVWSANPKVAATWAVRPATPDGWTRVRLGAATGIKPPTAFDIAFTDNPGLKPERSRSVDAGLEHAFAGSTVVLDATWFANRYDDLIVSVGTSLSGASRYRTDNISNARARGLEAGATWRAPFGVRVRAGWTWLDTEILGVDALPDRAPAPFTVGDALVRRPRHRASLDVSWTGRRATAFLAIDGRGRLRDLEPNYAASIYDAAGWAETSIGASLRLGAGVEVFGRVRNLFDRDYEEALGYPAPGRLAMVGIRVAASR